MSIEYSVTIFNENGGNPTRVPGAEIRSVTYHDQDFTKLIFHLSIVDAALLENPRLLQIGRLVLVRLSHMPDWGGVIWTPQTWSVKNGIVQVTVLSPHFLLETRYPPQSFGASDIPAGEMILQSFRHNRNKLGAFPFIANDDTIGKGGGLVRGNIEPETTLFKLIQTLAKRKGRRFWFSYEIMSEKLRFVFNFRKKKNIKGNPILIAPEGAQWGDPAVAMTGGISTAWLMTEQEAPRGAKGYVYETAEDAINKYGRFEGKINPRDLEKGSGKRRRRLRNIIRETSLPTYKYKILIPVGDNLKSLMPGSRQLLWGNKAGVDDRGRLGTKTITRVIAMEYRFKTGYVEVVLERVNSEQIEDFIP